MNVLGEDLSNPVGFDVPQVDLQFLQGCQVLGLIEQLRLDLRVQVIVIQERIDVKDIRLDILLPKNQLQLSSPHIIDERLLAMQVVDLDRLQVQEFHVQRRKYAIETAILVVHNDRFDATQILNLSEHIRELRRFR